MLLMLMLNTTELSISPWDTPLVTAVQLNFVAHHSLLSPSIHGQFSIHLTYLTSLCTYLVCTSLVCLQGCYGMQS